MMSVANILSLFEVVSTPDGEPLDPRSFNVWLNRDAVFQGGCFIGPGYFCGDVIWTDIQAFTAARRAIDPDAQLLRYRGVGNGSRDEVRRELEANRPVILSSCSTTSSPPSASRAARSSSRTPSTRAAPATTTSRPSC